MPASISWSTGVTPPEARVLVRQAHSEDRETLEALFEEAVAELRPRRGMAERLRRLGPSQDLLVRLLTAPDWEVLVATAVADPIAFAVVDTGHRVLEAVYVMSAARRRGVATALVLAAEERCTLATHGGLSVVAAAGSRAEKSLFEKLGYRGELILMAKSKDEFAGG